MLKFCKSTKKIFLFVVIISAAVFAFQICYGIGAEPGSMEDPVVSQSYIEDMIVPLMTGYVDSKVNGLDDRIENLEKKIGYSSGQNKSSSKNNKQNSNTKNESDIEEFYSMQIKALEEKVHNLEEFILNSHNDSASTQEPVVKKTDIQQITEYVDKKVEDVAGSINELAQKIDESKFKVVNVKAGQMLIGGEGTEIILRVGKAEAITTPKGGLVDTTQGIDITNGSVIPSNHLLVVPVGDGRGFKVTQDVIVMIKGLYVIK